MKAWGYWIFAGVFLICRMIPLQKRKVLLFSGHNRGLSGNLLEMKRKLEEKEPGVHIVFYSKQEIFDGAGAAGKIKGVFLFFCVLPYHMATAGRVFLNDNFLPLGYCRVHRNAQIVQLWHGAGAFKKFGLSTEEHAAVQRFVRRANKKITHLFVTSAQIKPFYREAFEISEERIYATGIPITDIYCKSGEMEAGKKRFLAQYPALKGKKIVLYTPTFRQSPQENQKIMQRFPVTQLHQQLGGEWVFLIKMHPKYPVDNIPENSFCYNMTNYSQITDLYFSADLLITDYSSTIVEYVLLDKPVLLYAYDLEKYDRGFYRDYEKTVPGPVAHNEQELCRLILQYDENPGKRHTFVKLQYDYRDDCSSERIYHVLKETSAQGH
ncbi:MAG: CDP-glycerol glycerophosphotransferase family protein [Clostridiaceae bacterium]|nr:CDP-glycerol glycerophosphotransferase family protein [Clostridiaceae bacterium]